MSTLVRRFSVAAAVFGLAVAAHAASHPMDPLSPEEIAAATALVKESRTLDRAARFPMMRLIEMPKAEVLAWKPGDPIKRAAEVTVMEGPKVSRAHVDLDAKKVTAWKEFPGAQAALQFQEFLTANTLVKMTDEWKAAMAKRDLNDHSQLVCLPFSTGFFGDEEERGKRLIRVATYFVGDTGNYWGRPVEGVIALVDLGAAKVVSVTDSGIRPLSTGPVEYEEDKVGPLEKGPNPIRPQQEGGASYTVDGNVVHWQHWSFHLRFDAQVGIVLSNMTYRDGDRDRSVLYQAALSELFVPYMDPSPEWYYRTFLDAGEYSIGLSHSAVELGLDCPENALLIDAVLANPAGKGQERKGAIAVFERATGDPAWRHMDAANSHTESRAAQELVVRSIAVLGNYDYVFDWIFQQNGSIRVRVGATGIDSAKGVVSRDVAADTTGKDGQYGRFVADHIVAVNHDHFLAYRLDFDIDGAANSFSRDALVKETFDEGPRRGVWRVQSEVMKNEADAKLNADMMAPALWRVINPAAKNGVGYPTSFQIEPGHSAISMLSPDDWPQRRAVFSKYMLHVTPYSPEERYAGGDFPNQGDGSDGLGAWTKKNRKIEDTDIVAWYTVGFHHVVRAEDWPVMPTSWHEFTLRPFDFFDRNPALNLPSGK